MFLLVCEQTVPFSPIYAEVSGGMCVYIDEYGQPCATLKLNDPALDKYREKQHFKLLDASYELAAEGLGAHLQPCPYINQSPRGYGNNGYINLLTKTRGVQRTTAHCLVCGYSNPYFSAIHEATYFMTGGKKSAIVRSADWDTKQKRLTTTLSDRSLLVMPRGLHFSVRGFQRAIRQKEKDGWQLDYHTEKVAVLLH